MVRGSTGRSLIKRERAIVNQTNIGTVSKVTLVKLLRDGIEPYTDFFERLLELKLLKFIFTKLKERLKESYESKSQQQTAIKLVIGPWISTSCHPHRSPQEDTNSKQTKTITYLELVRGFLLGDTRPDSSCRRTLHWCCNPLKTASSS